jgi:ADP-ribose pyrophosphatase
MEILRTEKLTDERWVNLFARTYRHNNREGRWVFASNKETPPLPAAGVDAVVIVPILRMDGEPPRLVVIREFRVPLGDYEYGFPAGLVDPGESVEAAARRELKEETGLEVETFTRLSPPTYSSSGMSDQSAVIAFVTARAPADCRQSLEPSEDIEVFRLDYRQVCDLCNADVRINGRTWPILFMFQELGRLC